jgi:glycosyltransferase involved in cell wall biosynthesis
MDIIALAPNRWDGPWMNRQQLLSRLAADRTILYSTGPWRVWDRADPDYVRSSLFGSFDITDGVIVDAPGKLLLRVPSVPRFDRVICRTAANRWRRRVTTGACAPLAVWAFHPSFEPLVDAIRPDVLIYHAYDLYRLYPEWAAENLAREARLLDAADLIIGSSPVIVADLAERTGRQVELVANGVDFGAFTTDIGALPEDVAAISEPRIGFIGHVNRKVDIGLLASLSVRRPDWQIVIVGSVEQLEGRDDDGLAALRSHANVHLLGNKPRDLIPAYTRALDVGLLCYRTEGAWTDGIYPLKLHEYLACGLPVISSDFPLAREFPSVVWRAGSVDEWESCILRSLEGRGPGDPDARRAVARSNSWDMRVEQLKMLLNGLETRARPRLEAASGKRQAGGEKALRSR